MVLMELMKLNMITHFEAVRPILPINELDRNFQPEKTCMQNFVEIDASFKRSVAITVTSTQKRKLFRYPWVRGNRSLIQTIKSDKHSIVKIWTKNNTSSFLQSFIEAGYYDMKGRKLKKELVDEVQRRKQRGEMPPVYPNGWFALLESRDLKHGQVKHVQALGISRWKIWLFEPNIWSSFYTIK